MSVNNTNKPTKPKKKPVARNKASTEEIDFLVDSKPKWYVVQVYVGFEDAVRKTLQQKINTLSLADKILEIYIPTKKVIKLDAKGERKEKIEKVHPGYIYINMVLDREVGYVIQNTSYISRITGTGNMAVALDPDYIKNLKEKLAKTGQKVTTNQKYNINDLVMVSDGAFKGMQGRVCALDLENQKITVLLSIFDRETAVELDVLEIKPV